MSTVFQRKDQGNESKEADLSKESLSDMYGGYWGEHPDYPLEDWLYEAVQSNTRLGYWEWVITSINASLIENKLT